MCVYYHDFIFREKVASYFSFLNDYYCVIITRCRLSNHDLLIETGHYTKPYTVRENRLCKTCDTIVNE